MRLRVTAQSSYQVFATDPDNAASSLTVTCAPASGAVFPLGSHAATRITTVTCSAQDPAGNRSPALAFTVTVVGAHGQLLVLEQQVRGSHSLSSAARTLLLTTLRQADRLVVTRARIGADTKLAAFIAAARGAKTSTQNRRRWIGEAARVIAVLG